LPEEQQRPEDDLWAPHPGRKAPAAPGYPPEPGRFLRGNDLSPVAVCVILKWAEDAIPDSIEQLVRVGVETGAALSGTLQTENTGIEKMVCNLVANPNIRYLVLCGPESPGHSTGQAVMALSAQGVDDQRRIIGAESPTPYLYNLPPESIARYREQIRVVDLLNEGETAVVRQAVWSCYQEEPTAFGPYELFDPGAFPREPICTPLTWRIRQPWYAPRTEKERGDQERLRRFMDDVRQRVERTQRDDGPEGTSA